MHVKSLRFSARVLAVALLASSVSASAFAGGDRAAFAEGVKLLRAGQHAEALALLRKAETSYREEVPASLLGDLALAAQGAGEIEEAASYAGPSLIIAYSHCIAHGYDLSHGLEQQKRALASGVWPLYRYDPRRTAQGLPALQLDHKPPSIPVSEYMSQETRFRMVEKIDPDRFRHLSKAAQRHASQRVQLYQHMASLAVDDIAEHN